MIIFLYDKGHGFPWPLSLYSRFCAILKNLELDCREASPVSTIVEAVELTLITTEAQGDVVAVASPFVLDELTFLRFHFLQIAEDDGVSLFHEDEVVVGDVRHPENFEVQVVPVDRPDTATTGSDRFEIYTPVRIADQNFFLDFPACDP